MPTVAVATDFSPRADRAVDRAKLLQKQMGGKLLVIHATNQAADDQPDMDDLTRRMRLSTGLEASDGDVQFLFPSGAPTKAIAHSCEKHDVDLLVLGPARYNTLGDYFLGTAVDYILRSTTKPVLVVKMRAHADYREIVAGTDFSPGSAHAILTAARMFPEAKVHVVNAWQVPFQAFNKDAYAAEEVERDHKNKLAEFMAGLAEREGRLADATSETNRGDACDALRKGLEVNPNALVVLGSHGTSGFRQATIGSVTSDLLRYLEADTLVINSADAE
ncbi:putative universal stress protein [Erythrobacter sp. NAP1]|uniref:universal stress protein n=1 Tax=Erythrobacter sp. NAP1 TaxID=237727 RepID=UPI0000686EFC|nr:universal stress protein [Erythrobacter sp. NAP1]EAQ30345.1 putative universal stress protein [Erythrobacter sp. NAP1]